MQIKIIIIGVLVGCSYLIGDYICRAYTNRHKQVNDLIKILEIMRMDLSFGMYTLEEIFKRLSDKKEYFTFEFFRKLEYEMHNNNHKVLDDILNENIHLLTKEAYLQNKEVDELKKLILTLGKSDVESQTRMIDLCIGNLKNLTNETNEDINKKGVVYKKVSTIIGLAIGIILI